MFTNFHKLLPVFCLLLAGQAFAQPGIEYDRLFGNPGQKIATNDGGYLFFDSGTIGDFNYHVAKYSAAETLEWEKTYKGDKYDFAVLAIQTSDGGYLLGGNSNSNKGLDKSENSYDRDDADIGDYWVIKITANGTKEWDRTLGGPGREGVKSLLQTPDGGFLIGGSAEIGPTGYATWIINLTQTGGVSWDKIMPTSYFSGPVNMRTISDGGYLLAGNMQNDYGIIKLLADGTQQWEKRFGGGSSETLSDFEPTSDGGFILGGTSSSGPGGAKTGKNFGLEDYWLVKVNAAFEKQWDRTFGGSGSDWLNSVKQTSDGGYIISGRSRSGISRTRTVAQRQVEDIWVIKTAADGAKLWEKALLGTGTFSIISLDPVPSGGYLLSSAVTVEAIYGDKTIYGTGWWELKLLAESNANKLSFSKQSLAFTVPVHAPDPAAPQSVVLSANAGNPFVSLFSDPSYSPWLLLPAAALGTLPFSVDGSEYGSGERDGVVVATAPGYERAIVNVKFTSITPPRLDPIGDRSVLEKRPLTFTASTYEILGQTVAFSLEGAPAGASINARTGVFSWTPMLPGTYKFLVKVTANNVSTLTDEAEITVNVIGETENDIVRVNAGGGAYTATDGRQFGADQYFGGGFRTSSIDSGDIAKTPDDALYRSGRCDEMFWYHVPVRDGVYQVTLHFAEIWFGNPKPGRRLFNVDVEGVRKLTNYNISSRAGGTMRAEQETFEAIVDDGVLSIQFESVVDLPRLAALEIVRVSDISGYVLTPVADAYVRGGSYSDTNFGSSATLDVKATTSKIDLFRKSYLKFSLAGVSNVGTAKLRVYGANYEDNLPVDIRVFKSVDDSWTENGITYNNAPNSPMSYVTRWRVDNAPKYYEVDVTGFVQDELRANGMISFVMENSNYRDRRIVFNSREAGSNPPQLVIQTTPGTASVARLGQETILSEMDEAEPSTVYPNPAKAHFTVSVSTRHGGPVTFEVISAAGNIHSIQATSGTQPGEKAKIDMTGLSLTKGIYILKIQSDAYTETVKMLITE